MAWVHDTGFPPAYRHEGYVASVLSDGTDTSVISVAIEQRVVGWRAACDCGCRSQQLYPRAEWPSPTGRVPEVVDGWATGEGAYVEWEAHLADVLPDLAVHDLSRIARATMDLLDDAVREAHSAGLSWARIGVAAGISVDRVMSRWGSIADRAPTGSRPMPPIRRDGPTPSR